MMQGFDQQPTSPGILEEVVLQIRIAPHDPDVAKYFIEHARGTTGAPLLAKLLNQRPNAFAQEANDDLPVREGSVVVGDLAQPCRWLNAAGGLIGRWFRGRLSIPGLSKGVHGFGNP